MTLRYNQDGQAHFSCDWTDCPAMLRFPADKDVDCIGAANAIIEEIYGLGRNLRSGDTFRPWKEGPGGSHLCGDHAHFTRVEKVERVLPCPGT